MAVQQMPCPSCRGYGDTHGQRCIRCGGSGDIPATEKYLREISVPIGPTLKTGRFE